MGSKLTVFITSSWNELTLKIDNFWCQLALVVYAVFSDNEYILF